MLLSLSTHTRRILRAISAQIVFVILLVFMLANYFINLKINVKTQFVTQMIDPIRIMTVGADSSMGMYLMLLYPILVVFPTCTTWLSDKGSGVVVYFSSRSGRRSYWFGKLGAVFFTTFLIFVLPFLAELFLIAISYDPSSLGDPSGISYVYALESDRVFFMYSLWAKNRYLYAFLMILLWGAASGILASFNFALSTLSFMRFRIMTFFPVYVLLYGGVLIEKTFGTQTILSYNVLFQMFYYHARMIRNDLLYFLLMMGMLAVSVLLVLIQSGKDQLL